MDQTLITRIVEAALLAANQPLTLAQLRGLFTLDEPAPDGSLEQALEDLRAQCADRGIELAETASGYRFQVQADVHAWVARLWTERQTKYTRATLETLAIIAYRQPITKAAIEAVRGVACDGMIQKLLDRDLIRIGGRAELPGRPLLYETTDLFFEHFGIRSIDDLPNASELRKVKLPEPETAAPPAADPEHQLALGAVGAPAAAASDASEPEES